MTWPDGLFHFQQQVDSVEDHRALSYDSLLDVKSLGMFAFSAGQDFLNTVPYVKLLTCLGTASYEKHIYEES